MVINASWKIKARKKDMEILLAHTARWGLAFRHVGLHRSSRLPIESDGEWGLKNLMRLVLMAQARWMMSLGCLRSEGLACRKSLLVSSYEESFYNSLFTYEGNEPRRH